MKKAGLSVGSLAWGSNSAYWYLGLTLLVQFFVLQYVFTAAAIGGILTEHCMTKVV